MLSKADGSQCAAQHHLKVEDLPSAELPTSPAGLGRL